MSGFAFVIGCVVLGYAIDNGLTNIARAVNNASDAYRSRTDMMIRSEARR